MFRELVFFARQCALGKKAGYGGALSLQTVAICIGMAFYSSQICAHFCRKKKTSGNPLLIVLLVFLS